MTDQEFRVAVGQRVRLLRGSHGQGELAKRAGVTQASISNYETGRRELPLSTAARLAQSYAISVSYFVPDEVGS